MNDRPEGTPPPPLTAIQRAAIDHARHDLADARRADLAELDAAALIFLVEQLGSRLESVLQILDSTNVEAC